MRYLSVFFFACILSFPAQAQLDTLQYDGITDMYDGRLIAVTRFPGEVDVVFNARFSPEEKCWLQTILVGFSVVKFQPLTGDDTLIIYVYESNDVPPSLRSLEKTYKVGLGGAGYPSPNIRFDHPLESAVRDVLAVELDPPIPFSPKRDFIVGVKLQSNQKLAVGDGLWNGFSLIFDTEVPEYERYRRYMITTHEEHSRNRIASEGLQMGLLLRALVSYDPDLPPIEVTDVADVPVPVELTLEQNWPNPFNPSTMIRYSLPVTGHVSLAVYDALGRVVSVLAEGRLDAGEYNVQFDARNLPGGVYVARLSANGSMLTRKMLLVK